MLISLAITAALLTAVTLALDASFTAYAQATQATSAQSSTRLVVHRIQSMLRGGVAQGPLTAADAAAFSRVQLSPSGTLNLQAPDDFTVEPIQSSYLLLDDAQGQLVVLDYDAQEQVLYLSTPSEADPSRFVRRPLLQGVTQCSFSLSRRRDRQSNYQTVLLRGGIDLTVQPGADSTLGTEAGNVPPIRLVASTSPRRLR